jgi:lysophospholipase
VSQAAPFHQLPGDTSRPADAYWLTADDGVRLRIAVWDSRDAPVRGSVLLFPGRTEYVEKYADFALSLAAAGYTVMAIDWRGQGMSDRLQADPRPGHVGEFADYQRDVIEMVVAATEMELPQPWHLLSHSMGGCIGLAALHDGLPVRSAVFSAPMWGINLRQMPHRLALGIAYLAGRLGHGGRAAQRGRAADTYMLDEAFSANLLTGDIDEWCRLLRQAAAWPDLMTGGATFNWVSKALNECTRLAGLPALDLPSLTIFGTDEQIVSTAAIRARVAAWPQARLLEIQGGKHELIMCTPERRQRFFEATLAQFAEASGD